LKPLYLQNYYLLDSMILNGAYVYFLNYDEVDKIMMSMKFF